MFLNNCLLIGFEDYTFLIYIYNIHENKTHKTNLSHRIKTSKSKSTKITNTSLTQEEIRCSGRLQFTLAAYHTALVKSGVKITPR